MLAAGVIDAGSFITQARPSVRSRRSFKPL
jgi:hypothetical protein